MVRFLVPALLVISATAALGTLDFHRQQQAAPGLTPATYLDRQVTRLLAAVRTQGPAETYQISRMASALGDGGPSRITTQGVFSTIDRSVHGTKVKPDVGIGMCRVEGGRKSCSPFAD